MPMVMDKQHPDSAAIDRVGYRPIMEHFDMTSAGVSQWKKRGIPKNCRRPLALLGQVLGYDMPELPSVNFKNVG